MIKFSKPLYYKLRSIVIGALSTAVIIGGLPGTSFAEAPVILGFGVGSNDILDDREVHRMRSNVWARGSYEVSLAQLAIGISLTLDGPNNALHADGSFISASAGSWVIGLGAVDRQWSFSPNTSLILSHNARPLPSIFLRTDGAITFTHPIMAWIGPWESEIFLGNDSRSLGQNDVHFFGARVIFEPYPDLKFELVRTAQFTGGLEEFGNALLGNTNEGTSAEANQMAGFGVSYRLNQSHFYMQAIGEDEAGGLPSCWMYLAGIEHQALIGSVDTVLNLEVVDTRIKQTENGFCGPNTAYNNNRHPYTNDGIVMGAPIDSEGRSIRLQIQHDLGAYNIDWSLGYYMINNASSRNHRLSSTRISGPVAHMGLSAEHRDLNYGGRVMYQGFDLDRHNIAQGLALSIFAERLF